MPEELVAERLVQKSTFLTAGQWEWLERRAAASQTRSASTEVRRIIAEAMDREKAAETALAA